MNLYVVRHADAEPLGGDVRSDFDRTLSERGRSDATLMAHALAQIDIDIRAILTSPLVRAVETGEIFARELKRDAETSRLLEPGFHQKQLLTEVMSASSGAGVVVIGHQPDMGMFISYLISPAHVATVAMETCTISCIHIPTNGNAQLLWQLTPRIVKSLNIAL